MAGELTEGVTKMFVKDKVSKFLNPPKSANRLGTEQRQFNRQANPGVNPWELAGGGSGGGGGGTAAAVENQKTSANATRQAADTTAQAPLKRVSLEYQKLTPEIDNLKSSTHLKGTQAANIHEGTIEHRALNKSVEMLSAETLQKRTTGAIEAKNRGDIALHKGTKSKEIADAEIKQKIHAGLQASQQTQLQKHNTAIAKAQAKVATALTQGDRSDWVAAAIALGALMTGVMRGAGVVKGIKNHRAPKTSTVSKKNYITLKNHTVQ